MLSSGVTSLSKILSFAFDFDEDLVAFESRLSPAHVPALDGGSGYSSGSLSTVDALEGEARLLEATEVGERLETR